MICSLPSCLGLYFVIEWFPLICAIFADDDFCFPNGLADKNVTIPKFSLVNEQSLDKILKAKVLVHSDGQLRAVHIILCYTPISTSFQVPKCVIKVRDPHLHQISVAVPSFLTADPILKGILKIALAS